MYLLYRTAGCDTKSIFKRSKAGLNSEFSFSYTGCLTKTREPSLYNYLPLVGERRTGGFMPFKDISAKWNINSIFQDLNSGHRILFSGRITVTLIASKRKFSLYLPNSSATSWVQERSNHLEFREEPVPTRTKNCVRYPFSHTLTASENWTKVIKQQMIPHLSGSMAYQPL